MSATRIKQRRQKRPCASCGDADSSLSVLIDISPAERAQIAQGVQLDGALFDNAWMHIRLCATCCSLSDVSQRLGTVYGMRMARAFELSGRNFDAYCTATQVQQMQTERVQ